MKSRATVVLLLGAWGSSTGSLGCGDRRSGAGATDAGTGGTPGTGGAGGADVDAGAGGRISCRSDCLPGACQPTPLATGLLAPAGLALDATAAYFTNTGADTVMKVDKEGGPPVTIVPHRFASTEQPYGIAVTDSSMYWVAFFRGFIARAGLGGENPVELSESEGYAKEIAVDGASVYWTVPSMIRKMSRDGGTPVTLISANVQDLALDGTSVYWTDSTLIGSGTVMKMGLGGENPTALALNVSQPRGIAVDATSVYWTDYRAGTVTKIPMNGGAVTTLATGQLRPWALAVDASGVYWTDQSPSAGNGRVMKVVLEGGDPFMLASGQQRPTRIALDACHVYWLDEGAGTVMKVPK